MKRNPARSLTSRKTGDVDSKNVSERLADDYDVLMGYQIFLGRSPENSFVVHEKKGQPLGEMVLGLLNSQEFSDMVGQPLARGGKLAHSASKTILSSEHISWIEGLASWSDIQCAALKKVASWQDLFSILASTRYFSTMDLQRQQARDVVQTTKTRRDAAVATQLAKRIHALPRPESLVEQDGQLNPVGMLEGHIEFYGYHGPSKGFFFGGWLPHPWPLRDRAREVIAHFEGSDVATGLLKSFYYREDLRGRGIGFTFFLEEGSTEPCTQLNSLEIRFFQSSHKLYLTKETTRLEDGELAHRLKRVLSSGEENSHRRRMKALLTRGLGAIVHSADNLSGYIDFYGYHSIAGGWLICGWMSEGWQENLRPEKFVASFEDGDVIGEPTAAVYPRVDLGEGPEGIVFFVPGPPGPLGALYSIGFEVSGVRRALNAGTPIQRLRETELVGKLRGILAGASLSPQRDTLVALLNRQPYTGQDTLTTLTDDIFLDLDEAIFCAPDSLLLIGWCLAKRDIVRSIRLRSGNLVSSLDLEKCVQVDRPDVLEAIGAKYGFDDRRCGFIAFLQHSVSPDCRSYLEVQTKRGETGYRTVPAPKLEGIAAVKRVLGTFSLRYMDIPGAYDRVIGPAIELLNVRRLKVRPSVTTIDFGVVPSRPKFSIIVPLYGRLEFAEYQLGLFSAHEPNKNVEFIYVLDDPAKRNEAQFLFASMYERFRIPFRAMLLDRNVGFAPATNLGLNVANGSYVAFVNSDVFPGTPDWLERLAAQLSTCPELGVIGPLLLFEDGSVQHQGMYLKPLSEFGNFFFGQHSAKGLRYVGGPELRKCMSITGACMVMDRLLAEKLGGFDESYILGDFEDTDLCLKLHGMGLQSAVDPAVQLYHLERKSQESSASAWRMNLSLYNAWFHHRRWSSSIKAHSEPSVDECGVNLRGTRAGLVS